MHFGTILQMSMTGSIMIAAVLLVRPLMKHWGTYGFQMLLWGAALVLLFLPFRFASPVSIYNAAPELPAITQAFTVGRGLPILPMDSIPYTLDLPSAASNVTRGYILAAVWLCGVCVMLVGGMTSAVWLRYKFRHAVPCQTADAWTAGLRRRIRVCHSARTATPITYGILRPRIILPMNLPADASSDYMLHHEIQHIRNHDALLNLLWLGVLCLHWFNPLVWVGWVFLRRDMEARCDAQVVKRMGAAHCAYYAQALLDMACVRRTDMLPLAFGASSVGSRIKRVLAYRPASKCARLAATTLAIAFLMAFATNPMQDLVMNQVEAAVDLPVLPLSVQAAETPECDYVLYNLALRYSTQSGKYEQVYSFEGDFTTFDALQMHFSVSSLDAASFRSQITSSLSSNPIGFGFNAGGQFTFHGLLLGNETEAGPDYYILMDKPTFNSEDGIPLPTALGILSKTAFSADSSQLHMDNPHILWLQ